MVGLGRIALLGRGALKGAQCTKADRSIKRMKTRLELNSTAPDGGSIEEVIR